MKFTLFSRKRVSTVCIYLLSFCGACSADLEIIHFNVGMGDSTLIRFNGNSETVLIDAGNRGLGKKVILPALEDLDIKEIKYFIATHYDSDHIGGFDEIFGNGIVLDTVIDRGDFTDREAYTNKGNITQYGEYLEAAKSARSRAKAEVADSCEPLSSLSFELYFVYASGKYISSWDKCETKALKVDKSDDNGQSIAMLIQYKNFRYFIGGDLPGGGKNTVDIESKIAPTVGNVNVLKLNHHGSSSSSNVRFLSILQPSVAVISVGNGGVNRSIYKLPNQLVLNNLANSTSEPPVIYLTNKGEGGVSENSKVINGHIVIRTNGYDFWVNGDFYKID